MLVVSIHAIIGLWTTYTEAECSAALQKFQDVSELSEVDRVIARLRFVPFYRRVCAQFDKEWDAVELDLLTLTQ